MKVARFSASTSASEPGSFRVLLQSELARRCSRNPRYSLRAFAADAGLDHSTLSQILRERRPLTERTIRLVGRRLKLADDVIDAFVAREKLVGADSSRALGEIRQLAGDTASVVADLSHYTILELVRLRDFRPDSRWIARALGLTVDEVNMALARLLRLGLLEMTSAGVWKDRTGDAAVSLDGFAMVAIRQFEQRMKRLRARSLESVPPGLRDHSVCTFALQAGKLATIVQMIRRFQRELAAFVGPGGPADDVYQLEVSLFPATRLTPVQPATRKRKTKEKMNGKPRRSVSDRVQES